jgi:hypothetical protein
MLIETRIAEVEIPLVQEFPAGHDLLTAPFRSGWTIGAIVLAGLLLTYLVTWVEDLRRVSRLEAEPTPPSKVITRNEAWQRIYQRPTR